MSILSLHLLTLSSTVFTLVNKKFLNLENTDSDIGGQRNHPLKTSLRLSIIQTQPVVVTRSVQTNQEAVGAVETKPASGKDLNKIRKDLGVSINEFAELLNISRGTLCSYIYGIVKIVPATTIRQARLIADKEKQSIEANKRFFSLSMREIIENWAITLGIDADGRSLYNDLAQVLGIEPAAIWRWRERNMRPHIHQLKKYDDIVSLSAATASPIPPKNQEVSNSRDA